MEEMLEDEFFDEVSELDSILRDSMKMFGPESARICKVGGYVIINVLFLDGRVEFRCITQPADIPPEVLQGLHKQETFLCKKFVMNERFNVKARIGAAIGIGEEVRKGRMNDAN